MSALTDIVTSTQAYINLQTGSGAHQASYFVCTGDKVRPGRDGDHSPPSSAKVKNKEKLYFLPSPSTTVTCRGTALLLFTHKYNTLLAESFKMAAFRTI
jgi:hypothetical protein